mmetsp:Transcript_63096/g.188050  ORF Transcript_63096/g.188050 Transcript_63096/m.188050 type:complete len:215 (+) Transcript_63096:986-1630(+)
MALRPVPGSSIVLVKDSIALSSAVIWVFLRARLSLLVFLSVVHHASWSASAFSSAARRSIIFWISANTMVKGLLASSMPAIRLSSTDFLDPAAFRSRAWACCLLASCPSLCWRCLRTDLPWKKLVGPLLVAPTAPKVSKAASLFRMEMASAIAASSFVRSMVRSSYSFAFWAHIDNSCSRNASASAFCFSASASCPLFVARVLSLVLSDPCFDW